MPPGRQAELPGVFYLWGVSDVCTAGPDIKVTGHDKMEFGHLLGRWWRLPDLALSLTGGCSFAPQESVLAALSKLEFSLYCQNLGFLGFLCQPSNQHVKRAS